MSVATVTKAKAVPNMERLMTAEEFVRIYSSKDMPRAELINGQVVERPMPGFNHGQTALLVGSVLTVWVRQRKLGRTVGNDTFFVTRRNPDRVRGMDFAFVSYQRWPKEYPVSDGPVSAPPELVIEVRSPTDRAGGIAQKTKEYLAAGVNLVVNIDPKKGTATVHRKGQTTLDLMEGDVLDLNEVLPGFAIPLRDCFE